MFRIILASVLVIGSAAPCFAASTLQENSAKQSNHPRIVERTTAGTSYAWVERSGVQCSIIYKGAHARQEAQKFADSIR